MLSKTISKGSSLFRGALTASQMRCFGAMNIVNKDLFEHKFTNEMEFRSSFDKVKCFRVLDEEGNVINKKYESAIDEDTLKKMFRTMVMINEADVVYNQA